MDKPEKKESNALDGFFNIDSAPTDPTNNPLDDFFKIDEPQNDPLDDFFRIDEEPKQPEMGMSALGRPKRVEDFNLFDQAVNGILSFGRKAFFEPIETESGDTEVSKWDNFLRSADKGTRQFAGSASRGLGELYRFMTSVSPGSDVPMTWNPNNKEQAERAYEKRLKNEDVGGQLIEYADKQKDKANAIDTDSDHWTGIAGQVVPYTAGTITAVATSPLSAGVAAGVGASNLALLGLSSFGSGIEAYDDYKYSKVAEGETPEIDPMARLGVGLLYGTAEFAMERVQLKKFMPKGLTNKAGKLFFGSIPEEIVEKKGKELVEQFAKSSPTRGKLLAELAKSSGKGSVFEGSTELATEVAQEFTNWLYYEAEDRQINEEFFEQLTSAYIGGSMMGSALGPLSYGSQQSANRRRREKAGQVVLAQNKTTGEALEIIAPKSSKDESAAKVYQAVKPNGKVVEVSEEELSDLIQLSTESFNAILQGKADAEALISEKDNADLALTAAEQRAQIELATSDMVFRDDLGNETLQPAMLDGEQYYITGFDPNNPDLVFIKNQEGVTKGLSRKLLDIQEPIPYQQWLDDNSGISNEAPFDPANPIQIGEEIDIDIMGKGGLEMHNFKVSGLDRESGQVQLESTSEDGYFETVDIETFNQYRKEQSTSDLETSQKLEEIFNVGDEVELEAPEQVEEQSDIKEIDLGKRKVKIQTDPNGNMRVVTDKVMTKTQAKSLATSIKNKFSRLQFEVVDETNPDDPFSPDSFALVFNNPANNIPDGSYLKNGEEITREGAIQLIEQGSFENLEINNDSELKNRLTKAKKEAQAPEASQLLSLGKDEKMEAIHGLIDRFNQGEEALRPDIDLLAEDLKVNVIKKTRAGKDIAIADRKSGQVINPKPVQNENAEIQQDEQKTAIEENEGQSNQQEILQAEAQEVDPNQSTSPEQTQERKQNIISFIGQDPQNFFSQLGLKMPAGKRKKAMFEDMTSESPSPQAQELLSKVEDMAKNGYIDYHHEGGGVESIPIDDFLANVQEEAAPEEVQSEIDRVVEEFTDENGSLKLDELEKQDDGFFTQFPFSLNEQELQQLRQIISNERAAQTTEKPATGEAVDSSQQQEPQTPEATVDSEEGEGTGNPEVNIPEITGKLREDVISFFGEENIDFRKSPISLEKIILKDGKVYYLSNLSKWENSEEEAKYILEGETDLPENDKAKSVKTENVKKESSKPESEIEQSKESVTDSRGETSKKVGQNEDSANEQNTVRESEAEYVNLVYGSEAKRNQAVRRTYNQVLKQKLKSNEPYVRETPRRGSSKRSDNRGQTPIFDLSKVKRRTVLRSFKEAKVLPFENVRVKTPQDIADLFLIHRSPYIEKIHLLYTDDSGNVLHNSAFTLNKPDRASLSESAEGLSEIVDEITAKAEVVGATKFSIIHNHPSGNPEPSNADRKLTYFINEELEARNSQLKLNGHVVIDTDKFSFIDGNGDFEFKDYLLKPLPLFEERTRLMKPGEVVKEEDVAQFAEMFLKKEGAKSALIFLSPKLDVSGFEIIPTGSPKFIRDQIEKWSTYNAGSSLILYVHDGVLPKSTFLADMPSNLFDIIDIKEGSANNLGITFDTKRKENPKEGFETLLAEEQVNYKKQTDSPEFKAWFGDSKVVDEEGNPLVVYHGTAYDFNQFEKRMKNFDSSELGYYFTSAPIYDPKKGHYYGSTASEYANYAKSISIRDNSAENIMPVYLSIKNPLRIDSKGWYSQVTALDKQKNDIKRWLKDSDYDGVIVESSNKEDEGNEIIFVALEPTQIKSATGNQGTFDPSNPDIRFKKLQPTGRSIESEQVEDQVSKLTKDWKNAPKVNIYRNIDEMVNDVPELRPYVSNRVAALYHKGQVFINAAHPKHRVNKGTEKILLHEVIGHHGVRGFVQKYAEDFKTEWENILENTFERNKQEPIMSKLAFTYFGKTLDNITQDEMFELAEEYIAHAAESSPSNSLMARIRRFFRRMLNKLGIKTRFTNDDLNELIRNAYRFVQNENGEVKRRIDVQFTIRYDKSSQTNTPEFKKWFSNSKVVDENGEPIVLYHQTHKDNKNSIFNDGFDLSKKGARASDEGMPDGIFMKPTNEDIGVGGIKENELQIPLFASIKNPLVVRTREQLMQKYMDDTQYVSIIQDLKEFDNKNSKLFDEEWENSKNFTKEELRNSDDRFDKILDVWKEGIREKATKARERLTELIQNDGYDGLIVESDQGSFGRTVKTYVAFKPNQVKSSSENTGEFNPDNPGIRFKIIPESELHDIEKHTVEESEAKQRNRLLTNFNKNSETWTKFTEAIQDNMVRGKRLIDQKQGDKVKDSSNFYVKENLAKGRTLEQTERFMGELYKPLLETGREMNKKHKVKITEISDYLYALHAPERNAFIAENNPKAPENPSGMSNEEAEQILKAFEAKVPQELRDQLTKQVKAINNFVNRKRLASGLISKEVYEQLQDQYEHYVPLRGWEDIQDEDSTVYSPLIAAKGRSSKAANVIPYLVTAAQEAIMKGEANMVRQSLLEFVKENPDANQYQIRNAWYKKTGEQDAAGNDIWEETLERPTKEEIEAGNAYRSYNQEIQRAVKSGKPGENVISVMVNGKKVYIDFKRPELAQAIKNTSKEKVPKLLAWLRSYTRWLSSMYTQYSPEFGIRNLIRDFGFGSFNAIAESGFKNWGKMSMEVPQSMWSLTKYFSTGKYTNTKDSARLKEFIEAGGLTGYSDLKQAKEIYSKAEKEINRLDRSGAWNTAKSMTDTGTKAMFKPIEVYNRVLENAVRFAYFKSLRTDGLTPQQAAIKAKDLTVNFNRKGNSSSVLGTIFMFFNASVQGNERLFRNLMSPKTRKKASVMIGSIIAAGFAQGMLFGLMDDDDEDGEKFYNKVPDYIKRTHIVIPNLFSDNKGEYLKIPLPYGINVFYSSGEQLASVLLGSQKPTDASLGLMTAASDSFSPVGGFDFEGDELNIWQKLVHFSTPSVASPITDLAFNRTFTGAPIAREPFIQGQPGLPDSEQYFPSVNPAIKNVTDALNKATGGDNVQPGWLSINPEWIEHGMRSYFGGPIQFAENTSKTITTAMQGESIWEDPHYRKIPFFRNYVQKSGTDYQARQEYYEKYNELNQINFHLKQYVDNAQPEKAKEYIQNNRNELRLFHQAESYNKAIKKLNNSIAALNEDGGFNESVDQLYDQRSKLYKQFNKLYNEVMIGERPKTLNEIFK